MSEWQEKTALEPQEEEKLIAFVNNFVTFYEKFLTQYNERLQNNEKKPGKWADFINELINSGKDATEVLCLLQKCVSSAGIHHNRNNLKKLIKQLCSFKEDELVMRKVLVESGIEIFQSFASQFDQVTADGSWERAMEKLAHDAVNRVLDYSREKVDDEDEEFSFLFVTKGVLKGKSKKYTNSSTGLPHFKPGHTVEAKNSSEWNTAKLFKNVGLTTTDGKYYRRKKGKNAEYGYRLLFQWESQDQQLLDNYQEDKAAGKCVEYKYSARLKEQIKNKICGIGNEAWNLTKENDISFDFQKLMKQTYFDLENFFTKNHEQIIGMKEELMKEIQKGNSELNQGINEINQGVNEIKLIIKNQNSVVTEIEQTIILFDVRESVSSFAGREEKLKEITENFKNNQVVVISGLGGVGKSELAVRYARDRYRKGEGSHVLWINAETQETAKDSYRNLLKELNRKTLDKDGAEKTLRLMAKEAHKLFVKNDSLFIFDNAEDYSIIEEFLPSSEFKFHVLVTSQNKEVLGDQKCGKVEVNILTENEAVDFVEKALGVTNDDQNAEIKELVKTLGYLPLALQHAVAYLKKSGLLQKIGKYLEVYAKSEQQVKNLLNLNLKSSGRLKTIFVTFKTAIDHVKEQEGGKLAEEILNTIAYFSPDNIPKEAFSRLVLAANEEPETDVDVMKFNSECKFREALNLIANYSLINCCEKKPEHLSMHRLVQQVIITAKQADEAKVLQNALGLLKEFVNRDNAASCVPHIMSIWDHAYKHESLVKMFILDPCNNKATQTTPHFHLLIEGCSFKVISHVIKKISAENMKDVISARNKYDLTPLHKALLRKDEMIIQLLINVGADVNAKQPNGMTPLHFAAKNLSLDVVNALLENHAQVNAETQLKFTPLHFAAKDGRNEIVEALLAKNANVNAETEIKFTPLHLAAKAGTLVVVKTLLNHKEISINARTQEDATPLHLAAQNRHLEVVDFLLLKNADVNAQNERGFTPLHFAALHGHDKVVFKLLKCSRTDVNARTSQGKKALDLARLKNYPTIIQALIDYNAEIFV